MRNKKEVIKSLPSLEAVKSTVEIMKISGAPFQVSHTNKTTSINGCLNFRFIEEDKSVMFFAGAKQLKKEVSEYLQFNAVPQAQPQYFGIKEMNTFVEPEIYNIDLTAAYLYVLYNSRIISRELFEKLLKLPKIDRLASIGMLASKKIIFSYDEHGNQEPEPKIYEDKQLSNVFFYCVEVVNHLMDCCKMLLGDDFIFYWVDGIYFKNDQNKVKLNAYLYNMGYPCKFEVLKNFLYFNHKKSDYIEIEYLKLNKKFELKPKKIIVPKKRGTFSEDMYNYLNQQHGKSFSHG